MQGCLCAVIFALFFLIAGAQKKWVGPATGNWEDELNWMPRGVPVMEDDIILDNTYQPDNYSLSITTTTVNVHTLSLAPANGRNITLIISAANKNSPALIINGSGNSLQIYEGAILRNSSGLSSGQSIQTAGTVSIYNGGHYIHNSRSSHATEIVANLSSAAGTEKGIFEFDVPGGSYPISFSNRTYGTLILSSNASGGVQTYNASGTSPVQINGDFQMNGGVQFNLDLTKDMTINNDFIQNGGVFNAASQANNNTIRIKGNVVQASAGTISETSTGLPVIELAGYINQQVAFAGSILNSVTLKINNQKGISLSGFLTLPYKLQLSQGVIKTSKANLLILLANCTASGGSAASFIDGPVKKIGNNDFEFPVGKQGDYAPIRIIGSSGAITDEFNAEYFLNDPGALYGNVFESPPIVRISKLEYWMLERTGGTSTSKLGVSVGNYSNATDLRNLVLVRWDGGTNQWKNEGNSSYTGIAVGDLVSNNVDGFGAFTLGSTVMMQNPLLLDPVIKSAAVVTNKQNPDLKIFHSGMKGYFYLQVTVKQNDMLNTVIYDVNGRQVMRLQKSVLAGLNKIPIDLSQLASGIYFISLSDKSGKRLGVGKIVK